MRPTVWTVALLLVCAASFTHAQPPSCASPTTPIGALPPAVPIWCEVPGPDGPSTFVRTSNGWLDDFEHGLSNAPIGTGYLTFAFGGTPLQQHFRHADHWMQDLDLAQRGGTTLRPEPAFRFQDGKLVIEADVAAGIQAYGSGIWPEITVTTAAQPTGARRDALYAYDHFPGHHTLGCRLQSDRIVICALFDDSTRGISEGGRIWEMSFFQPVGTQNTGGGPWGEGAAAWRVCKGGDPDLKCRDRFRLELTPSSLVLHVNGIPYFSQRNIPTLPQALLERPLYTYFSGVATVARAGVARFHWDRVAVNVGADGPPPSPPAVCRLQRQLPDQTWETVAQPYACP